MASLHVSQVALILLQANIVLGEMNVYDKPMVACGSDHSSGCTYTALDSGAHQVCVNQLPQGFSSDTGQGPWSNQFTGQPWCICIWAYSNYILQNKDLQLKCESIPSKVLEEKYSLDKFKQCGEMSSTDGCGNEDIRRSIQSLCQQCDAQAGDDHNAKMALNSKCNAILASAPAAPLQRLYSTGVAKQSGAATLDNAIMRLHSATLYGVLVAAGLLVAMLIYSFRNRLGNGRINQDVLVQGDEIE